MRRNERDNHQGQDGIGQNRCVVRRKGYPLPPGCGLWSSLLIGLKLGECIQLTLHVLALAFSMYAALLYDADDINLTT